MNNNKLRIIFFGTPDFVLPVLQSIHDHFTLVGVVTAPDAVQGRKKILTPSPVKQFAQEHAIKPTITPQQFNNETIEQLQSLVPDLFVVAAYGKIIPKAILEIPRFGALNIHPSLLPKYRGPSPIQSSLLSGDSESGVTIIRMDEKMDHGPILMQEVIHLTPTDTFRSLHYSMFKKAAEMLPEGIAGYTAGSLIPKDQDHEAATICRIITKEDGYFDSTNPPDPETLDRMIRAYYPWPTAWTKIRIKNQESRIMKFLPDGYVQLEGGKPMRIKELLNGYPELREVISTSLKNHDS